VEYDAAAGLSVNFAGSMDGCAASLFGSRFCDHIVNLFGRLSYGLLNLARNHVTCLDHGFHNWSHHPNGHLANQIPDQARYENETSSDRHTKQQLRLNQRADPYQGCCSEQIARSAASIAA
jgi:hypothetical protein